jgi:glyceraldehyde 3-phosphate dehydrogenase
MKKSAGINGFGRFGLHLLKYWLDRNNEANFTIDFINDDTLSIFQSYDIIIKDEFVIFNKYKIKINGNELIFLEPNGSIHKIQFSNNSKSEIPWLGKPDIFFECSGKNAAKSDCTDFIQGNTERVIISATSWDPDITLVYGFNHEEYKPSQKVISYGSCTVNAYLPLANYLNYKYGVEDSDVNVVHNIQKYRLEENNTLIRKFCTLEKSATNMLDFVNENNFVVNYTVIPYTGVSMIDFRFRLQSNITVEDLLSDLEHEFLEGSLKNIYGLSEVDIGPEVYNCTTYSTVLIKENIKIVNGNLYLPGYFDNENSVNRYFDLIQHITNS